MKIKRGIRITVLLILILLNAAVLNNCESLLVGLIAFLAMLLLIWRLMVLCKPYMYRSESEDNPTSSASGKKPTNTSDN